MGVRPWRRRNECLRVALPLLAGRATITQLASSSVLVGSAHIGRYIMKIAPIALAAAGLMAWISSVNAQAWRNCNQGSIGPGGCESIGPGGGLSIGPGGGQSIGPGGGLSIGPGGGQSFGPGGGLSIAPGGGLGPDRDWSRGLDPRQIPGRNGF